jgi:hypothetical protein
MSDLRIEKKTKRINEEEKFERKANEGGGGVDLWFDKRPATGCF